MNDTNAPTSARVLVASDEWLLNEGSRLVEAVACAGSRRDVEEVLRLGELSNQVDNELEYRGLLVDVGGTYECMAHGRRNDPTLEQ